MATPSSVSYSLGYILKAEAELTAHFAHKVAPSWEEVLYTSGHTLQRLSTVAGTLAAAGADFSGPSSSDDSRNDVGSSYFTSHESDI